jgi:hypothetical protein
MMDGLTLNRAEIPGTFKAEERTQYKITPIFSYMPVLFLQKGNSTKMPKTIRPLRSISFSSADELGSLL